MPNQIINATQQNDVNGNPLSYTFNFQFDDGNGNIGGANVQILVSSLDTPTDVTGAQTAATTEAGTLYQNWLNQLYSTTTPVTAAGGAQVQFANIVQPPALIAALAANPLSAQPASPAQPEQAQT